MDIKRLRESIPINVHVYVMEWFMQKWNLLEITCFPKTNFKKENQLKYDTSIALILFIATLCSRNH